MQLSSSFSLEQFFSVPHPSLISYLVFTQLARENAHPIYNTEAFIPEFLNTDKAILAVQHQLHTCRQISVGVCNNFIKQGKRPVYVSPVMQGKLEHRNQKGNFMKLYSVTFLSSANCDGSLNGNLKMGLEISKETAQERNSCFEKYSFQSSNSLLVSRSTPLQPLLKTSELHSGQKNKTKPLRKGIDRHKAPLVKWSSDISNHPWDCTEWQLAALTVQQHHKMSRMSQNFPGNNSAPQNPKNE